MINGKKALLILWGLIFTLTLILLFFIPEQITSVTFVFLVFDCFGFVALLIFWIRLMRGEQNAKDVFGHFPAVVVSCVYLLILFVLSILCGLSPSLFSVKSSVLINIIIMVIAWIVLVALLGAKGHIQRVDSRQRDHRIEL